MKRSEMIQVIKDSLYCHLPGHTECPDFIAEAVLQSVEGGNKFGVGMLPNTFHWTESDQYTTVNAALDEMEAYDYGSIEWEAE